MLLIIILVVINKVYEAYHFRSRYPIFKCYIDNFYKKKAEAKDPLDRTINKLMLNSLYGIIGVSQSGEKFTATTNDGFDAFAELYKVEDVVATTSEFTFFTYNPVPFNISNDAPENNKLIGSGLDRDIEPNPSNVVSLWSSGVNLIYTDTDSIICDKELPSSLVSNSEIGKFKREYPDKAIKVFFIIAPKAYEIRFSDGSSIIKFKGVKTDLLTSDDIDGVVIGMK